MTDIGADDTVADIDAVQQAKLWLAGRGVEVPAASPPRGAVSGRSAESERPGRQQNLVADRSRWGPDPSGSDRTSTNADGSDPDRSDPDRSDPDGSDPHRSGAEGSGGDGSNADATALARSIVLRKLLAQARTRQELSKALKAKDVPEDVSRAVLDRMEEVGLVDDAEFARGWVKSRQSRRHLSKSALRRELSGKGVAKEQIDGALDTVDTDDEYATALALAQKKYRAMAGLEREVQYRRLAGALARRGFGSAITSSVLTEVLST